MRRKYGGRFRRTERLRARAAVLAAFVMMGTEVLTGAAAGAEGSPGQAAAYGQGRTEDEGGGMRPATSSNFFDDLPRSLLSQGDGAAKEGEYGGGFKWTLDEGLLTIAGEGDIPGNYRYFELPWYSFRDKIQEIVIEDGVTGIGEYLFCDHTSLISLVIPESVTHIGEHAFFRCSSLENLVLPDTVVSIGAGAFEGCPRLPDSIPLCRGVCEGDIQWRLDRNGTLTVGGTGPMPDGTSWVDFGWFSSVDQIEEIIVEDGITTVGDYAFDGCENVLKVTLPSGLTSIGKFAFRYCESLAEIRIPQSVAAIRYGAFAACASLENVTMADSVVTIEGGAFSACPKLKDTTPVAKDTYSAHLQWAVTKAGVMTVSGDGEIPDMGQAHVEGEEDPGENWNTGWIAIEDTIKRIVIQEGITAIGRSAFASCKNLVAVELPDSLKKIGTYAFNYCLSLAEIKLPKGLVYIGRGAFTDTSITSVVIPETVDFLGQASFPPETQFIYERTGDAAAVPLEQTDSAGSVISSNIHRQNYGNFPVRTTWSNLWEGEAGTLFRTEYVGELRRLLIEEYSPAFQFMRSWEVPMELPVFGGFFEDGEEFYIVFGQKNPEERDDAEVVRVVRYTKNMERLDSLSLYGLDTTIPFTAGNLRMDKKGPYLYIHTSHEKFLSPDGNHHQANMTIIVNTEAMAAAMTAYGQSNSYSSHSFNQFIKADGDRVITVDQADGFPARAVILGCYPWQDMEDTPIVRRRLLDITGMDGENYTGVMVGGLEASDQSYLTAWTSIDQENFQDSRTYNVYLSVIDKEDPKGEGKVIQITDYKEGESACGGNPALVKISDSLFALMWGEIVTYPKSSLYHNMDFTHTVRVVFLDGEGRRLGGGETGTFQGSLSDCQPMVYNGQVVWYVTDGSTLTFYAFPAQCPDDIRELKVDKTVLGEKKTDEGGEKDPGGGAEGDSGAGEDGTGEGDQGDGSDTGGGKEEGSGGDHGDGDGSGAENGDEGGSGGNSGSSGDGTEGGDSGNSGGTGETDGFGGDSGSEGGGGSDSGGDSGETGSEGTGGGGGTGGGSGGSGGGSSSSGGGSGSGGSSSSGGGSGSGGNGGPGSSKGNSGAPGGFTAAPDSYAPGAAPALTGVWRRDAKGWWLEKPDRSYPRDQWARINGAVYRFDQEGYMMEGWIFLGGRWYYSAPGSGALVTGWAWIRDRWYYLGADGIMATGWIQLSGIWYYLNSDGAMATGWILDGGKWYYLYPDGAMAVDTRTPDGYAVGADGAWIT